MDATQPDTTQTNSPPARARGMLALLKEVKSNFKAHGFKGLIRIYGWKIVAAFFVYYLIRDSILYIILPWLIARHFISSS